MSTKLSYYFVIGAFLSVSLFPSCKSKKKLSENTPTTVPCNSSNLNLDSIGIIADTAASTWYKIKGEANIELNQVSYDIDIQLRIKPNDIIWISLSKAGFPVAKILLNEDSVYGMDLFHKKYFKSDYESLAQRIGIGVDFKVAQSILLGQFIPFTDKKFKWSLDHEMIVSNQSKDSLMHFQDSLNTPNTLLWAQWMNCRSAVVKKQFVKTNQQEEIWVKYDLPDETTPLTIPTIIELNTFQDGIKKLFSTLEYKKFKTSKSLNIPFEIPEDYVEME